MHPAVICDGITIAGIVLPPFEVGGTDYVGLACPTDYGSSWAEVLEVVGGKHPTSEVHCLVSSSVLIPSAMRASRGQRRHSLIERALKAGLSQAGAEDLIVDLRLESDQIYEDTQLHSQLLFDLRLAWSQRSKLVVFSTAGLARSGYRSVALAVSGRPNDCAAIDVIHVANIKHDKADMKYTKIIQCGLI
ncbi:hypothetical protein [Singulisphaera acidiphila]|uniref:Uncharacterized protein n=1 Tax=Singulisphaera acidiphila (strain ATCC BAA-1392 / DSM 18658 / VKM B-2454 / MOB10) TaxID=886293 RepID=L0D7E5_SINAD|nr:hypothetical protein [Singulisphaera acidiphila]AGA24785.1 hypothetical protein Sinac_0342 [Singulisphaera acidiphila DSM 18658]